MRDRAFHLALPFAFRLITYAVLIAGAVVMLLPFVWMTSTCLQARRRTDARAGAMAARKLGMRR